MSRPRLLLVPSRAATRRLLLLSLLAGAGVSACSSTGLHPVDAGPGIGGAIGQVADAGPDSPTGAGGTAGAPGAGGGGGFTPIPPARLLTSNWQILNQAAFHKVDILFMVDNSSSMLPLQSTMLTSFPAFANALKALPGGLPDLHLGVVSSDTGPGKFDLPAYHCAFEGDRGQFQSQPRGICSAAPLPAGQTFLQASNNQQTKNYTGDIADAFTCIAALGDQGCGFEGQLKSVRWALDPLNLPAVNNGFLRPDAFLAVVLLTNEDDCSLPDDSDLVDPTQTKMSDPLGPLWSWRCNEFGHLCNNANGMLQSPPRASSQNLQGCVSNDGSTGKLTHLGDEVAFLKSLKTNQGEILAAAITGPSTPYSVEMILQGNDVEQHPNVVHSCILSSGEFADPAVRLTQWAASFGANGSVDTICADSLAPAMQRIGNRVAGLFSQACAAGPFAANGQPACRVVDQSAAGYSVAQTLVPNCSDSGSTVPCWTAVDDTANCGTGKRVTVNRGPLTMPPPLYPPGYFGSAFTCDACAAGSTEIGCN